MSIESFSPLPLNIFGTWVTLLDPLDVPAGMSPSLADVEFFPGGVRTRAGLQAQFSPVAGAPQNNAVKTYATTNLVQRFLRQGYYTAPSPPVSWTAAARWLPDASQHQKRRSEYATTPDFLSSSGDDDASRRHLRRRRQPAQQPHCYG
jgi:hypothetical protein